MACIILLAANPAVTVFDEVGLGQWLKVALDACEKVGSNSLSGLQVKEQEPSFWNQGLAQIHLMETT